MALGDQAGLQAAQTIAAAVAQFEGLLPGIMGKLTEDEASALKEFHSLVGQAGDLLLSAEQPIVAQITRTNDLIERLLNEGIQFRGKIGGTVLPQVPQAFAAKS